MLESPQWGGSYKYRKHMLFGEIRPKQDLSYISICSLSILYKSKFIIMATSVGTNDVVVTRVHCKRTKHVWNYMITNSVIDGGLNIRWMNKPLSEEATMSKLGLPTFKNKRRKLYPYRADPLSKGICCAVKQTGCRKNCIPCKTCWKIYHVYLVPIKLKQFFFTTARNRNSSLFFSREGRISISRSWNGNFNWVTHVLAYF